MNASRAPNVLVVDDELYYLEILTFILEAELHANVMVAGSLSGALEVLGSNPGIDFIVCDDDLGDGGAKDVLAWLARSQRLEAPFILLSARELKGTAGYQNPAPSAFVRKPFDLKTLAEVIRNLMNTSSRAAKAGDQNDYCKIRVSTLLKVGLLYQDLFLRLPNDKYIKVMHQGDPFDRSDAERFALKKLEHLYIHRGDAERFVASYLTSIGKISSQKEIPAETGFALSATTVEFIHDVAAKFGWSPALLQITRQNVELALKAVNSHPSLAELLARVEASREGYFGGHATLVAYIACGISKSMDWSSDPTLFKLSMASMLHDMTLTEDEMDQFRGEIAVAIADGSLFKEKRFAQYREHPLHASQLVAEWPELPPDVDTIILQHHERPDGKGFPHRLSQSRIHPLAAVLIVAEDMADHLFDHGTGSDLSDFFNRRAELYGQGQFKKIYNALAMDLSRAASGTH